MAEGKDPICKDSNSLFCKYRKHIGLTVIIAGLFISYWLGFINATSGNPYYGLGFVGFGTFLVMLVGTFLITDNWDLNDGEFRKALTISIISVYFFAMAFGDKILVGTLTSTTNATVAAAQTTILGGLFNNLWAVVLAIVAFYFSSRAIDDIKKK